MFRWLKFHENKKLLENMDDQREKPSSFKNRFFLNFPVVILFGVIMVVVILVAGTYISQEKTIYALKNEENNINAEIKDLSKQRNKLEKELEEMSSPLYIEKQAREKLKMVKPGEIVYIDIRKNQ